MTEERVLGLYCVIDGSCELDDLRGAYGERLRPLSFDGVTAIVGELTGVSPPPTVAALRGHDALLRRLGVRCRSLVPMRFGQSFADERALEQRLLPQRERMTKLLRHVAGCVQMAVRVGGDGREATTATDDDAGGAARPGTRYLLARRGAALPVLDPLRAGTRGLVRDELIERSRDEHGSATLYQLVPRDGLARWRAAVAAAVGAEATISGPAPPYAFVRGSA